MTVLTHVQVVDIPVSDQQAALDFYVGALGLAVVADVETGPHGRWLQVAPDGVEDMPWARAATYADGNLLVLQTGLQS